VETAYEQRLRETVEELKGSSALEVRELDERPLAEHLGDASSALAKIGEFAGLTLPPGLGANFHRHSELHVEWRAKEPDGKVGGEFRLLHIGVAIMGAPPDWPAEVARDDAERKLFQQFRFFDLQPSGGTGTLTGFRLAEDAEPTEVWFYDPYRGFLKLDVDYGGYLDALLVTRGIYYWQYLFADAQQGLPQLASIVRSLARGVDFLGRAFPGDDLSELRDRLAVRQRAAEEYWDSEDED
jgi:hypothetical protein